MTTQTQSTITLFIKEWEKEMEKTKNELAKMDLFKTVSRMAGTNALTVSLKSPTQLAAAIAKIKKIPDVSLYYSKRDHLKEVSDAIQNGELFKAFTLCGSLYESYGKAILISQFNHKPTLAKDVTDRLSVRNMIEILHDHKLIEKHTYCEMIKVNKTRNDFIHRYLSSSFSPDIATEIEVNTPKIMSSLEVLRKIYQAIPKEQ